MTSRFAANSNGCGQPEYNRIVFDGCGVAVRPEPEPPRTLPTVEELERIWDDALSDAGTARGGGLGRSAGQLDAQVEPVATKRVALARTIADACS